MRRPAMYLAGLFLATGASLALAASPAAAAGTSSTTDSTHTTVASSNWWPNYGYNNGFIGGYPGIGYPGGLGYLNGPGGLNGSCNSAISQRTSQIGLVNVNGLDNDNGGCVDW